MLEFYLASIIIWMIIIKSIIVLFKDGIKKKTNSKETKKASIFKRLSYLFVLAAVPILRLGIVIIIIYIATCKQEDFDKLMKKTDE